MGGATKHEADEGEGGEDVKHHVSAAPEETSERKKGHPTQSLVGHKVYFQLLLFFVATTESKVVPRGPGGMVMTTTTNIDEQQQQQQAVMGGGGGGGGFILLLFLAVALVMPLVVFFAFGDSPSSVFEKEKDSRATQKKEKKEELDKVEAGGGATKMPASGAGQRIGNDTDEQRDERTGGFPDGRASGVVKNEGGEEDDDDDLFATKNRNQWRCACENGFLPPGLLQSLGGAEQVFRMSTGQCYHTKKKV